MTLEHQFEQAQKDSKTIGKRPSNEILLQLYSLYKQGTLGNAPTEDPSDMFDIIGNAKYKAWIKLKGKTKEEAKQLYIDLVGKLL